MAAGKNVKQAVDLLKAFYLDMHSMMITWEGLLSSEGWVPRERFTSITEQISSGLHNPKKWLLASASRCYKNPEFPNDCIILQVLVDHPLFDDVQVMALHASYPNQVDLKLIWDNWKNGGAILKIIRDSKKPIDIPVEILHNRAFPGASRGWGFLLPIEALTDEDALREKLINPLLKRSSSV